MRTFNFPRTLAFATTGASQSSRSRAVRVLHVSGTLNRGGVETWLTQVLIRLPRERYECDVCTYRFEDGIYANVLRDHGCRIYFIPLRHTPAGLFRFGHGLRQLLRGGRYDVVHCHGLVFVGFVMLVAWWAKIPVRIGHSHNSDQLATGTFASLATHLCMRLNRVMVRMFSTRGIGCSEEAQEALFGRMWRGQSKYTIVHCGIDLTRFETVADQRPIREGLGIPQGFRVIGHVSNLGVAKNPRFLIEIAEYVFRRRSDVVLLIVGGGIPENDLERMCEERGIRSRVIFAGVRSDVPDLMRGAMDIFVMPSIHEGLPLALLEAQAAGLPCLASDTISREAQAGEKTIQFVALSEGAAGWGERILLLLQQPSSPASILRTMKTSDFNIAVSSERIAELYDGASRGPSTSNGVGERTDKTRM